MARVTAQGIEPTTLQGYIDALEAAFRSALGQDIDLAPETPAGQLVGTLALTLTETDEALVAVGNGMSRSRALGVQLDDLGSLLGIPRLEGETDDEYRARYGRLVARNARGSAEAILAAVLSVEGVADALIRENATAAEVTEQGKTIGAYSICLVVDGGTDEAVAAAIARSKPVGTGTSGETRVDVPYPGWSVPIRLSRVTPVPIKVRLALTLRAGFPSDGTSRIVTLVVDHVIGLALGERLTAQRLLADVLLVPGHTVNLGVGRKAGTVITGTGTVADLVTFHGRATVVTGTGTVAALATLQAITNGTVTFLGQTITGLDFSGDNDLDGVASTLQTALRATSAASLDDVEVVYDGGAFVVTMPLDSNGVVPTVSAAFTGDRVRRAGSGHGNHRQRCGRHQERHDHAARCDCIRPGLRRRGELRRSGLHAPGGSTRDFRNRLGSGRGVLRRWSLRDHHSPGCRWQPHCGVRRGDWRYGRRAGAGYRR